MGKTLSNPSGPDARAPGRPRRLLASPAAGAFVLLMLALVPLFALWNDRQANPNQSGAAAGDTYLVVSTGPSETRTLRLADGSRLLLQGDTSVSVRLGTAERRLDLLRGRARFEVFREPRRFVVHAAGGSVTARGTIFDVAVGPNRRVTVRLIEGSVDVTPPRGAQPTSPLLPKRLRPGQSLTYAAAAQHPSAPEADDAGGLARTNRPKVVREYEAVTLAQLLRDANRASATPIRLTDHALAARTVSGRFRIDDGPLLAERLAILFDLSAHREPDMIVLRQR